MRKDSRKKTLVVILLISLVFIAYLKRQYNSVAIHNNSQIRYYDNLKWMLNNRIMQYSAYIIRNITNGETWIECMITMIQMSTDLVGIIRIHDEIYEVEPIKIFKCTMDRTNTMKVFLPLSSIKANENVLVAVIRRGEFTRFTASTNNPSKLTLPFEMVNYQKPDRIIIAEPRKPSVALCVNYVHHYMNSLPSFLNIQKQFGIDKIIFYDASIDKSTFKYIDKQNYDFVTVHLYNLEKDDICSFKNPSWPSSLRDAYVTTCRNLIDGFFKLSDNRRHEDVTNNDCYIQLGYLYEFVGLYDVDELILPRNMNPSLLYEKRNIVERFKCDSRMFCDMKPFEWSLYDYIKNTIRMNHYGSIEKVNGVSFRHAGYLVPNELHKEIIDGIQKNLKMINSKSVSYPLYLKIRGGHKFEIWQSDIDYMEYLVQLNKNLSCILPHFKNATIDKTYIRHMYHDTQGLGRRLRLGKTIHYTKNVNMLFVHWAENFNSESELIEGRYIMGEVLAHFRNTFDDFYEENITTSIRKLNFDIEYLSYLLKTHSKYCKL